jgi:glucan 1,3-beta-glucosidase
VSTYLVGDALNPPTLVADPALGGRPVINAYDDLQGMGSSTKNFYMAVRNLVIDTTGIATDVEAVGLDYSVSQGCSLNNVRIRMPNYSSHVGITMKSNGSGVIISDCVRRPGYFRFSLNGSEDVVH